MDGQVRDVIDLYVDGRHDIKVQFFVPLMRNSFPLHIGEA